MPRISTIIPVYKVEPYLHRCVDSILNQTYTDFELILVDDGSPDRCGEICDEYVQKDSRIVVIHQENQGLSAARNAGIDWAFANSDSEWITFIDSDDWVHKEYLRFLYDAAVSCGTDISVCRLIDVDSYREDDEVAFVAEKHGADEAWTLVRGVTAHEKLYKKSLFANVRYPVGRLNEDAFTTHLVWFQCDTVATVDRPLYYYYSNPNSIMRAPFTIQRLDEIDGLEVLLSFLKENRYPLTLKQMRKQYIEVLASDVSAMTSLGKYQNEKKRLHKILRYQLLFHGNVLDGPKRIDQNKNVYRAAFPKFMEYRRRFMKKVLRLKAKGKKDKNNEV